MENGRIVNQDADSRLVLQVFSLSSCRLIKLRSFFGSVAVGTPPVAYDVILDTGSA